MLYDYEATMKADILEALREQGITVTTENRDELEQSLYDDLWIDDAVTGNGSGSYFFNSYKAREAVLNGGMDHFINACSDFGIEAEEVGKHFLKEDWEWIDVTIRCYLLGQVLSEVLDEIETDPTNEETPA